MLGGCAALAPREIVVSESELLGVLASRFPARRTVAGVADVTLSRPRLHLLPADNRVSMVLDISLLEGLLRRPLDGTLALSSGLHYDARRQAVLLAGVRTDQLVVNGAPQVLAGTIRQAGAWLVEQALEGAVVRQITAADMDRLHRAGRQPGDVRVTERGVVVSLEPFAPAEPGAGTAAHRAPVEDRSTPR